MMLRSAVLRDNSCMLQLAVGRLAKTDGERERRTRRGLAHRRDHDGRVDSAAEKCSERHIAGELSLDRTRKCVA